MTDFGTPEERLMARQVAIAARDLNLAINAATNAGVRVEVLVMTGHPSSPPTVQIGMERRTVILPAAPNSSDESAS